MKNALIGVYLLLGIAAGGPTPETTPTPSDPTSRRTPVFLVHGHGVYADSWNTLISALRQAGYPGEFLHAIQLDPVNGANIEAAEAQIAPAVESFLKRVNEYLTGAAPQTPAKTKVHMISHSMGSLSSRWYAARMRPDRVAGWISLAGANHGTAVACDLDDPGARDLCPAYAETSEASAIQFALNGAPFVPDVDETPYGVGTDAPGVSRLAADENAMILYLTIRSDADELITPVESTVLDGAGNLNAPTPSDLPVVETSPGNYLITNGTGHDDLLKDPDTIRLVQWLLRAMEGGQ